jgi:hypothetical protein
MEAAETEVVPTLTETGFAEGATPWGTTASGPAARGEMAALVGRFTLNHAIQVLLG